MKRLQDRMCRGVPTDVRLLNPLDAANEIIDILEWVRAECGVTSDPLERELDAEEFQSNARGVDIPRSDTR